MRKSVVVAAVASGLVAALTLTACSNSKGSSNSGGLSGGASSASGSGGPKQSYAIGFQGALSGDNQQLGINIVNGVNLAVDQANAKGDLPFKLTVVQSDDGGTPDKAPAAAAKLVQDQTVLGVVGPIFSGPTKATGATYAQAGLGLISPSATNETLTSSGFSTFHRIVPTDGVEGKATADWLAKKYKKVYVVDDTSTYGKGVADVVQQELNAKGVTTQRQGVAATTQDYGAIAQTVTSSGSDAMYYGGYDAQAALLTKALTAAGYKGFRISGNGAKSSVFTKGAGAAGDGYYFACGCLDATSGSANPEAKAFATAYQTKFNTPSSTYSPEGYDATNAMIAAYKAAAGSGTPTRASVESAIKSLDYKGITTEIKFADNGEVAQATVNLYKQENGTIQLLGDIKDQS